MNVAIALPTRPCRQQSRPRLQCGWTIQRTPAWGTFPFEPERLSRLERALRRVETPLPPPERIAEGKAAIMALAAEMAARRARGRQSLRAPGATPSQ